eukprot:c7797_g1_i1.p1 GENE.c7797_g1_i1~~c7797_g1_i1.p1  ORF type:complete len:326 (-),score=125.19 c7797_g1_i1:52-1029(-)
MFGGISRISFQVKGNNKSTLLNYLVRACSQSLAPGIIPELPDTSKKVKEVVAYHKNVKGSARRLNALCYMVRRLNAKEALAQMQFSLRRKYAETVANVIKTAVRNAKHNYNLDPDRLLVVRADVGRSTPLKRIYIQARGKFGTMQRGRSHLRIVLREIPFVEGEYRLGLRGKKHKSPGEKSRSNGENVKWRRRKKLYKPYSKLFDETFRPIGSVASEYLQKVQSRDYNEKDWLRSMRLRIPPTFLTYQNPHLRLMGRDSPCPPLQPNGGFASLLKKGERSMLHRANPHPLSFAGLSPSLRRVVRTTRLPKKTQESTNSKKEEKQQ